MILNLELLAGWLVTLGAIGAPLFYLARTGMKLLKRLTALESWTQKQQKDIENSKEERKILLGGTLACLKGLREQGCNGPVSDAIRDIEAFLLHESHRGTST